MIGISVSVILVLEALQIRIGQWRPPVSILVSQLTMGLAAVRTFVLNGRVEIRDQGIVVWGGHQRWPPVQSYAWERAREGHGKSPCPQIARARWTLSSVSG